MEIYVLKIWGHPYSFFTSKEKAEEIGKEIGEPTSSDGEFEYAEFVIEKWIEGEEIQHVEGWEYEIKLGKETNGSVA